MNNVRNALPCGLISDRPADMPVSNEIPASPSLLVSGRKAYVVFFVVSGGFCQRSIAESCMLVLSVRQATKGHSLTSRTNSGIRNVKAHLL